MLLHNALAIAFAVWLNGIAEWHTPCAVKGHTGFDFIVVDDFNTFAGGVGFQLCDGELHVDEGSAVCCGEVVLLFCGCPDDRLDQLHALMVFSYGTEEAV